MKELRILTIILYLIVPTILIAEDNSSKEEIKRFDAGLFTSTWGVGIQNTYTSPNWDGLEYVASLSIGEKSNKINGLGTTIKSNSTFQTIIICPRFYLKDLGILEINGLFGQAGLSFRNWNGSGEILDDRTNAKIGSIKMKWSPFVFIAGIGWKQIFDNMLSFSASMNTSIGGSKTIEYIENMSRFSKSLKNDLEKKTTYTTNIILYFGYRF